MIEEVVKHEAKLRAEARAHEAKLRAVVVKKKQELETQPAPVLMKLCAASGARGTMSKTERVQHLLKHWLEHDGVNKAVLQMAHDERQQALEAMDAAVLKELCEKAGIEPYVAEVMVDRISQREHEMGCYLRPAPAATNKTKAPEKEKKFDMVAAILESEKTRKKEEELLSQQEEAAANKMKEVKAMTIEGLKKALASRAVEMAGKNEDMVEAFFVIRVQEDEVATRKSELMALSIQDLRELPESKDIAAGGKGELVEALLANEAKLRERLRAFEATVDEVLEQQKKELEGKTNAELKDLCASRGVKLGVSNEERVERLAEEMRTAGEADVVVARMHRRRRREALSATGRQELVRVCATVGADTVVKEVMVERILAHEDEFGAIVEEPPAKKQRTSKK